MPRVRREDVRGPVIRQAGHGITPVARVTRMVWRGGAAEWHRPLAVEITGEGSGQPFQRIAIHDATRRAVLSMLLASLAGAAALAGATRWVRQSQQARRYIG